MRVLVAIFAAVGITAVAAVCGTGAASPGAPPAPTQVAQRIPPGDPVTLSAIPAETLAQASIFLRQPDAALRATAAIDAATAAARSDADTTPAQQVVLVDWQHYDEKGALQHQLVWAVAFPAQHTSITGQPAPLNEAVSFVDAASGELLLTAAF